MKNEKLKTFFDAANDILDLREKQKVIDDALRERANQAEREYAARLKQEDESLKALQKVLFAQYLKPALDSLKEKSAFNYKFKMDKWHSDARMGDMPAMKITLSHLGSRDTMTITLVNAARADYRINDDMVVSSTLQETLHAMAEKALDWEPKQVTALVRKQKKTAGAAP